MGRANSPLPGRVALLAHAPHTGSSWLRSIVDTCPDTTHSVAAVVPGGPPPA